MPVTLVTNRWNMLEKVKEKILELSSFKKYIFRIAVLTFKDFFWNKFFQEQWQASLVLEALQIKRLWKQIMLQLKKDQLSYLTAVTEVSVVFKKETF